jgi:hypothetical protein
MNPFPPQQLAEHAAERRSELVAGLSAERAHHAAAAGAFARLAGIYRIRRSDRRSSSPVVGRTADAT